MKIRVLLIVLLAQVGAGSAAPKIAPPDLTGSDAHKFRFSRGRVVSLRGRLEQGKEGATLLGATPTGVLFSVIPEVPPGGYSWPADWLRLNGHQVRMTGRLHFRSFDHPRSEQAIQIPPDDYYMVLQKTKLEALD